VAAVQHFSSQQRSLPSTDPKRHHQLQAHQPLPKSLASPRKYGKDPWNILTSALHWQKQVTAVHEAGKSTVAVLFEILLHLSHAELAAYADGQGITKDGKRVDQLGNQLI